MLAFHILPRMIFKEEIMSKGSSYQSCSETDYIHGNGVCGAMYDDWMLVQVTVWILMFSMNQLITSQWDVCKQWWSQQ